MIRPVIGKLDFHLHSYASNVTDYYAANSLSIPESYSDPIELYHELKRQGMTLVTLTDHNSIDGVLRMLDAGLQDVFISAEMTTTFPEDGCNVHVTIANMTEAQFAEANRLRGNIYEMIGWIDREIASEASRVDGNKLAYFMTHPLMSTQNRPYGREGALGLEHIEKALLLCNCIEVQNGTRTRSLNELTRRLIESLDRQTIERLANRHGIEPKGERPWIKAMVGGSDDHSGLNPGRTWTEFPITEGRRPTANDVILALRERATRAGGQHGGPVTLAHAILKLLYDGRSRGRAAREGRTGANPLSIGGPIESLFGMMFDPRPAGLRQRLSLGGQALLRRAVAGRVRRRPAARQPFEKVLAAEAWELLSDRPFQASLSALTRTDDRIFRVVGTLLNRIFANYVRRIASSGGKDVVRVIRDVVACVSSNVFVSLPYLVSYFHQSSDRLIVRDVRKAFRMGERDRTVLVTDTFFEINGVAKSIRRMLAEARRRDIDFRVVTCLSEAEQVRYLADPEVLELVESGQLKILTSIVNLDFPEYEGLQVRFPPFLDLLKYLQEEGFTRMQVSTPGTIGVAGLLAAKLLQLETSATYHTCFPEYVENYTRDISLEALTWKYVILFYHSVDEVVVPSRFVASLLHKRGLRNRKLLVLDRWVDLQRFHPRLRTPGYWQRHGIERADELVKFVYVGRLGVEKNLAVLCDAFRMLSRQRSDAHLIIIGDGPYRAQMEEQLRGTPATFVGFLEGEELARAVASADAKVFPSTTDTWGNAPLEAQASGLPVVVTDAGGPQELMLHGETGFRVLGRDPHALLEAMLALMDAELRRELGERARAFVEARDVVEPFTAILDSAEYRRRARRARHPLADLDDDQDSGTGRFAAGEDWSPAFELIGGSLD